MPILAADVDWVWTEARLVSNLQIAFTPDWPNLWTFGKNAM